MSSGPFAVLTLLVALIVSAGAPTGAAGDNAVSFQVPVVLTSPCTGEVGNGRLDVLAVVNEAVRSPADVHVTVHASVHGELTGNRGSVYHVSAEGTSQSSALADLYEVPFHGSAVGDGRAPNLRVDGVAGVSVDATGDPTGVSVISASATCGL
jgi:hypothetical protein